MQSQRPVKLTSRCFVRGLRKAERPILFGVLVAQGSRESLFLGYGLAGGFMCAAALVAAAAGVDAERKPLEAIARPLGAI